MHLSARLLTAACVSVVLLCIASLLVGAWTANRDAETALQQYTDTEALLALPPVDVSALEAERDDVRASFSAVEALLKPPSVNPASDAATTLLVRRATDGGLAVKGIVSAPSSEAKNGLVTYDVEGLRMIVEGSAGKLLAFLTALGNDEPGFIPALTSMTVNDNDVARAEISFNVYVKIPEPTPVAPAAGSKPQ